MAHRHHPFHFYVTTVAVVFIESYAAIHLYYALNVCTLLSYNPACYAMPEIPPLSSFGTALVLAIVMPIIWLAYVVTARALSARRPNTYPPFRGP